MLTAREMRARRARPSLPTSPSPRSAGAESVKQKKVEQNALVRSPAGNNQREKGAKKAPAAMPLRSSSGGQVVPSRSNHALKHKTKYAHVTRLHLR